jgi:hypothetical protein
MPYTMELKQFVIESIKQYRQGVKTVHELYQELKSYNDLHPLSDTIDLPHEIMSKVGLGAYNCNELFEIPDAVATRSGLIHLLQEYLAGRLTIIELNDWGENHIAWEVGIQTEDETVDLIAGNIIAQCDVEPENNFTKDIVGHFLRILQGGSNRAKEKVAVHLAYPDTFKSFYYYTADFKQGKHNKQEYEKYITDKFWLSLAEFPYWNEIDACHPTIEATQVLALKMLLMT